MELNEYKQKRDEAICHKLKNGQSPDEIVASMGVDYELVRDVKQRYNIQEVFSPKRKSKQPLE